MKKKNILLYFTDQQRADTCGCYGQELPITPVLDQLAAEGTRFDLAFTPQPVCGPCRAMFQTGKWATDIGCFRNNIMLPANVKPLGAYMEEAGYETAYVGKWHLASDGELEKKPTIDHTVTAIPRELRGGYTGFAVEITDLVDREGENLLTVQLDTREDPAIPPFGFVIDYLTYGGLYREVWLETSPQSRVSDLFVYTPTLTEAAVQLTVEAPEKAAALRVRLCSSCVTRTCPG